MNNILTIIMTLMMNAGLALSAGDDSMTDFEKAKAMAAEKKLPIMAVFTGSDWCTWCMEFEKTVLSKKEFKDYAEKSLVLFVADYPQNSRQPEKLAEQNKKLAEKYGIEAFPTVLILDAEGKVTGKTGFLPGGAKKYVEHLKSLTAK